MNTRIRELMIEAGYAAPELAGRANRLVELVVKECMAIADKERADYEKHRKSTFDFDEKNIYAEGEAACDSIKYRIKSRLGDPR
jgi:hypothetical protein